MLLPFSRQVLDLGAFASPRGLRCNNAGTMCMLSTFYTQPGFLQGQLYRSTDGGATWSVVPDTQKGQWWAFWCNPAGTVWIVAISNNGIFGSQSWGALYKSTDSGASFSIIPGTDQNVARWTSIECDDAGMKCLGLAETDPNLIDGSYPFTSEDGFLTLNKVTSIPNGIFFGGSVSRDGSKMLVAQANNYASGIAFDVGLIYYSDDGGATFTPTNAPHRYYLNTFCDSEFKCVS
jgi:hypothetical protein